nr:hypothetical protein Iba_chr02dCG9760 [Ipomoea batatas]
MLQPHVVAQVASELSLRKNSGRTRVGRAQNDRFVGPNPHKPFLCFGPFLETPLAGLLRWRSQFLSPTALRPKNVLSSSACALAKSAALRASCSRSVTFEDEGYPGGGVNMSAAVNGRPLLADMTIFRADVYCLYMVLGSVHGGREDERILGVRRGFRARGQAGDGRERESVEGYEMRVAIISEFGDDVVWEQEGNGVASFGEFIGEVKEGDHVAVGKPWEHGDLEL